MMQVESRTWEKRLVDETIGTDVAELAKSAVEWEEKYLRSLPYPGTVGIIHLRRMYLLLIIVGMPGSKKILDHLMKASRAYATVIHHSPKESKYHIALGMVLEELFYAEDLYGLAPELPLDKEGEAQASSKEEEFLAICKIHGVPPSAPIVLQLKAVEAEYQSLKEAGQTHKADHVQALYAWKSKKVLEVRPGENPFLQKSNFYLQAAQGSYAVDKESPLFKAKVKYQDALHVNPSDGVACYHFGRICLLMGEKDTAKEYLRYAVALKPTLSPARFCLGIALPAESKSYASSLLLHGLSKYLSEQQLLYETNPEPRKRSMKELHASKFYHGCNTLIVSD
jgi:tetratricopeptide (TPR) repeat protein